MEEARPGDVRHRRSDLLASMNNVHTESIDSISSNIVSIDTGDQHFSLMIVHKQSTNHFRRFLTSGRGPEQVLRTERQPISQCYHNYVFDQQNTASRERRLKRTNYTLHTSKARGNNCNDGGFYDKRKSFETLLNRRSEP